MAAPHRHDEELPAPAGVDAGPQSEASGAGGEPKGARLQAQIGEKPTTQPSTTHANQARPTHAPDEAPWGDHARPAGQSGFGPQDDPASAFDEPQGEGNYIATDRGGDQPLRNG